jgi:predicted nuclease of restriction endonuclease-like RecB superfamily
LLPDKLIPVRAQEGRLLPAFLGADDVPWLGVLIDEVGRFCGKPARELAARLREPLPCRAPAAKVRAAAHLAMSLWRPLVRSPVWPPKARAALFETAAQMWGEPRGVIVETVARDVSATIVALEQSLFADLPGERSVCAPATAPRPLELAVLTNELIAKSLIARATRVCVEIDGAIAPVVREAKRRGLLCQIEDGSPALLDLSGPFALFRRTLLYGRAMAGLVGALPWCGRFVLHADCVLRGKTGVLELTSEAPIFPREKPKPVDARLETRFAREFQAAYPEWELIRDPDPVTLAGATLFADFRARHRGQPNRDFFVEIIGFWTPAYLERKLSAIGGASVVLCIDETRGCAEGDVPNHPQVVRYRRRIDPALVIGAVSQ